MATSKHPPLDSRAKRFADGTGQRGISPETRELIHMSTHRDWNKLACMRDVKAHIDCILQGLKFTKGLALLDNERQAAFVLLDKAVGIKSSRTRGANGKLHAPSGSASTSVTASVSAEITGDPGTIISNAKACSLGDGSSFAIPPTHEVLGFNQKTRMALACPLVVAHRAEWGAAVRYLRGSSGELTLLRRALVGCLWTKGDFMDGTAAVSYLSKRSEEGVASAQSALGWIFRWGAGGLKKDVCEALRLWERAVSFDDPEAANGLGPIFHHGREAIPVDGPRALARYQRAVVQGYPAAAASLGVMLYDGAAGMPVDGAQARWWLDEEAVGHGDSIEANNLALLLQHGARGLQQEAEPAMKMYELAIARGERHHACRNLGELLWNGAVWVRRARANAVEHFRQAVERGDEASQKAARMRLRKFVAGVGEDDEMVRALVERCRRLVEGETQ